MLVASLLCVCVLAAVHIWVGRFQFLEERYGHVWQSFLAGAILINTLREEIPRERHGRFWPFIVGIAVFSVLAFLIESYEMLY